MKNSLDVLDNLRAFDKPFSYLIEWAFNIFSIVNFPFLDREVPLTPSYGIYISQLVQFAPVCIKVSDFNYRKRLLQNFKTVTKI